MTSSVFPTGTTIYDPERCWNGYTVFQADIMGKNVAAVLIDMNGNVVNLWQGLDGFPNKVLPGGYVMGSTGTRNPKFGYQDKLDLVQVDWDGNIVWRFDGHELIEDPDEKPAWMARQHHDYQREGNPVGYFVPGIEPLVDRGNTLILCHNNLKKAAISDHPLLDDAIVEVNWSGQVIWEWICSDHFDEMGFDEEARAAIACNQNVMDQGGGAGDWMHMNSMSALGPNRWYDQGDQRFHPDNIIWSGRRTNIIGVIDKKTGRVVWRVGPDYSASPATELGQIVGQHHAHLIPRGLPGEGNILVFDTGGSAGYGAPSPGAPTGINTALRDYSRVLEFDPTTLKIIWQYTHAEAGFSRPGGHRFYSTLISAAQRLANGNTLITEGTGGRIFEVTIEHEIVWEYVSPYTPNAVYRAYRVPYEWIPQVARPTEKAIPRTDNSEFRVPGSLPSKAERVTSLRRG